MDFIMKESYSMVPTKTKMALKEALADSIACTIAGTTTQVFEMVKRFSETQYGKGSCSIFMSHLKLSVTGAALVNATAANALDMDDGHRLTKGHPGAIVFPAVFAAAEEYNRSGEEFMSSLLVAYEVAIRAGILVHQLRPEYHCTGSWGAVGAAVGVSRVIGLNADEMKHALGIAEYQSTYSPMMRCIETPSMLKDAIGWGSMTGTGAAYLAKEGFTGIPSLFEMKEAIPFLSDSGSNYKIEELYFKPYACCRWAQPGIEAMKEIVEKYDVSIDKIHKINVFTFTESARLNRSMPKNTEEAQYNLTFPIAAYLYSGEVGPNQVMNELENPEIARLMEKIEVYVNDELNNEFPKKALSHVEIVDTEGNHYFSGIHQARGDYDQPLTADEKKQKFTSLVAPILGNKQCEELYQCIQTIENLKSIRELSERIKIGGI
ncbi:MmgE/PrpD family protein [Gottfriedia acidiceleris]|uniref:MmgE/PrpD family protein n=1 Tax=Gottfriedia acidiceleris TaxID=371036 RepID=UPI0022872D4D|nr:MmgE/PrpD family protein [Gottfriedia acidiceleris]